MAAIQQPQAQAGAATWLTSDEMRVLEAVCDTLIPSLAPPEGEDDPHGLYGRKASDLNVAQVIAETLALESPESKADFKQLLGLLNGPAFGLLTVSRPRSFMKMAPEQREEALQRMANSSLAKLRQGFQAVKRLAVFIFYGAPTAERSNPNWPALNYTPAPQPPSAEAAPKRIRTLDIRGDETLTADAVIVGSGAGGGMMAAELAAAGRDVLVIEKGGYYNEADFSGLEAEMTPQLFLRRGALSTSDLGMVVLAGSTLGGGTIVNWSTSLRTPPDVLEEWERQYGVEGATSADYLKGFEEAERRLGITTEDSAPNRNNAALRDGCEKLGYEWKPIPRNASGCEQRCGACGYGCPFGHKQSTMLTYLQDAHEKGARMLVRATVERVLVKAGRAVGVEGWALDSATGARHAVVVHAPLVIVSAGAVETPALLKRSGLTNPNIGRHLRLHPVAVTGAFYEEPVEAWKGSLQTVYSRQFANLKDNYGIWFEVAPAHPGMLALATPWGSGMEHKSEMRNVAHEAAMIVLARDTGEGHITLDRQGDPILHYWPSETDRRHLVRGMQEQARIAFAGGATRVAMLHTPPLILEAEGGRPGAVSERALNAYLREIEHRSINPNQPMLFSAHQMGTARMGSDPKTSATDPQGEVHGVRGLFVADGSLMPTAAGVNPMLSIYGLTYRVAQAIKARG
ncbi:MAG TPA: GMC family oxidoreductase N-terminal domain-containing protein [Ktedonobacterales bacterium]|jgi:choline dehydrogenase-like flavoprotein